MALRRSHPRRYFEIDWAPPGKSEEKIMFRGVDPVSYSKITNFIFSEAIPDEAGAMQALSRERWSLSPVSLLKNMGLRQGTQSNW